MLDGLDGPKHREGDGRSVRTKFIARRARFDAMDGFRATSLGRKYLQAQNVPLSSLGHGAEKDKELWKALSAAVRVLLRD